MNYLPTLPIRKDTDDESEKAISIARMETFLDKLEKGLYPTIREN